MTAVKLKPVNKYILGVSAFVGLLVGLVLGLLGGYFQTNQVLLSLLVGLLTALLCAHVLKWLFFAENVVTATSQMFSFGPFTGQLQIGGARPAGKVIRVPGEPAEHRHHHHAHAPAPAAREEGKEKEVQKKKKKPGEPGVDVEIE
ncbi:MAG TPA: hypothetical protein VJA40_01835 [archaeon]|nr:hypothetical protein [archaeon]